MLSECKDCVILLTIRKKMQVELSANAHNAYVYLQSARKKNKIRGL